MELQRIFTVVLRSIKQIRRDMNRFIMLFFWPFLDVVVWGFMGVWIQQNSSSNNMQMAFLSTIILWQFSARTGQELFLTFSEEVWSNNLTNFFATPVGIFEWLIGSVLYAAMVGLILIAYCIGLIKLFYTISLSAILTLFGIFALPLFLSGIFLGLIALNLIIVLGKKGSEAAFTVAWVSAPFCGVFYPRDVLPAFAQKIGSVLPMTYIFEGMRNYVLHGINPTQNILYSIGMSIAYIGITVALFFALFQRSKRLGLSRLSD